MSNSSLVDIKVPAYTGNYTKGRRGTKIDKIAIHHMAGVLTASQCGKIFQREGRKASSHYGIGSDGKIALYVNESDIAWTNSNWKSNCESVTIETSNSKTGGDWPVSDNTLNLLIKLVADIAKRNNLGKLVKGKNVVWHSMYANTNCPGKYLLSKMDYIIEKANAINNEGNKEKYSGTFPKLPVKGYFYFDPKTPNKVYNKGQQVKYIQDFLNWAIGANLKVDGLYGPKTYEAVITFQKLVGAKVDGSVGKETLGLMKNFTK